MLLPKLNTLQVSRRSIDVFRGLDLRNAVAEGCFADMRNLTSDSYPLAAVRKSRSAVAELETMGGMIAKDGLCYVNGSALVINGYPLELGLTDGPKQLVGMGAYVVIFPDKKYVNTLDHSDRGDLEAAFTSQDQVQFALCDETGEAFENMIAQTQAPANPADKQYWLDTGSNPCVLNRYDAAAESWVQMPSTYVCIAATGIGQGFSQGDGVEISGVAAQALQSLNGSAVITACQENYIVIPGILPQTATQDPDQGAITVERCVPLVDLVIESENRLWGCRYGPDRKGNTVNTLYACKLGDFKNWNCFQGLSTDSYAVSLGADGPFTGAVTHLGYPLFFRENCMHKVYGNYPANYQVQTTACRGVQQGSEKSLATVNGVLYYLGIGGVCAYDGSLPAYISPELTDRGWHSGVAGALGSKYYLSMSDGQGEAGVYVYDTEKHLWHREDALGAEAFCTRKGSLLCYADGKLWDMVAADGESVAWMAQTGKLSGADPDKRYISAVTLRLHLTPGATAHVSARYDGWGAWEPLGSVRATGLRGVRLPLRTRRCETLELRLEGKGDARLYSISIHSERGSDLG